MGQNYERLKMNDSILEKIRFWGFIGPPMVCLDFHRWILGSPSRKAVPSRAVQPSYEAVHKATSRIAGGILDVVIEMLLRYDTDPGGLGGKEEPRRKRSRVKHVDTCVLYVYIYIYSCMYIYIHVYTVHTIYIHACIMHTYIPTYLPTCLHS